MRRLKFALPLLFLLACDDGPAEPVIPDIDVRGNYTLTELSFDPQGSLPAVDLHARITGTVPRLVLAVGGRAQLVYEDLTSGLVTTVDADYAITPAGNVRVTFSSSSSLYRGIFLSQAMTFEYDETERSLTFAGTSPDGVARQQLLALVPEWSEEQLFDPIPGTLRVVYRVGT